MQVFKVAPNEYVDDRRVVITTGYDGSIISVEPENAIFGFPSVALQVHKPKFSSIQSHVMMIMRSLSAKQYTFLYAIGFKCM
jgi:hypothetical protein